MAADHIYQRLADVFNSEPGLLKVDHGPAGRGLFTTRSCAPGEVLLDLKGHSILNALTATTWLDVDLLPVPTIQQRSGKTGPSSSTQRGLLPLTAHQSLSLLLALWRSSHRRGMTFHQASSTTTSTTLDLDLFLSSLPESYGTSPLTWLALSESETAKENPAAASAAQTLFEALSEPIAEQCSDVWKRFQKDWAAVEAVRDARPDLLHLKQTSASPEEARTIATEMTREDFLWAWQSVNSRCLYLPLGLQDRTDSFTLAPLLDMANHTSDPSRECKVTWTPSKGMELRCPPKHLCPQGLAEGDEVLITYGAHSNAFLLSEYGFVLPWTKAEPPTWIGNSFSEVRVDHEVEALLRAQGAQGDFKRTLLDERGYWKDYTLHPHPEPAHPSYRLVQALRLLAIPLSDGSSVDEAKGSETWTSHPPARTYPARSGTSRASKQAAAAASAPSSSEQSSSKRDLERWEAILVGEAERISEANESEARRMLREGICDRALQRLDQRRRVLEGRARTQVEGLGPGEVSEASCTSTEELRMGLSIVRQLIDEESDILGRIREATAKGAEW